MKPPSLSVKPLNGMTSAAGNAGNASKKELTKIYVCGAPAALRLGRNKGIKKAKKSEIKC